MSADRLAEHEARANFAETGGTLILYSDYKVLVEIAKAARGLYDFLENEKETQEPPRELLDQGYVALERSADYEREEELSIALGSALARLGSGATEGDA